eukprot:scaffold66313_cov50-Attheya_sp.AAC.6
MAAKCVSAMGSIASRENVVARKLNYGQVVQSTKVKTTNTPHSRAMIPAFKFLGFFLAFLYMSTKTVEVLGLYSEALFLRWKLDWIAANNVCQISRNHPKRAVELWL